jgi:hypothetical protein
MTAALCLRGSFFAALAVLAMLTACERTRATGIDEQVTSLGNIEVTARLTEIPGEFPANELYNYAYVLKYQVLEVHRGDVSGKEILVGQYNPRKPRSQVEDELSDTVGGNVTSFRPGDVHRLALTAPLDELWTGGIIDKYFNEEGVRYWALWTNRVDRR